MQYQGFIGGSYESQAVTADQERTVNWYVERMESQGATSKSALYPTPGVTEISEAATTPGRAHFFQSDREFAVIGPTFYEIGQFGALTSRGTVVIGGNPATISSNGDGGGQLFITSGDFGYSYDLTTNALSQVTALNGIATMGDHLDGYFLAIDSATSKFYVSALLNGTSWTTGTDFAQRSIAPDPWKSIKVNGRYVWLLGEQTSEVWYDTGASFPFAPHPSGLVPYGIAAPFSAVSADGTLLWLGASRLGDAYVLRAAGFVPEVVSDFPLQRIFNSYATISDAQADTYTDHGHTFYLLNFPTENATWALDLQTGQWAERGTWISEDNEYVAWRPRWHAMAFGEHRMLDSITGSVYRMAPGLSSDVDDRPIRRLRRAPALTSENQRVFFSAFELDMEPGLGTSTGQGSDPQVMLRMSNDGGKTWGAELQRSAGKIGEYNKRVRWDRLGSARRRVFEVAVSDPIPWRLTAAYLTLGQGVQGQRPTE